MTTPNPGSYAAEALAILHHVQDDDAPLTATQIKRRMSAPPSGGLHKQLADLHDADFVSRNGTGKRGDPYAYTITKQGRDFVEQEIDPDADGDRDPWAFGVTESDVDALEERISTLEDVFGVANGEREDARYRLRQIEDLLSGADNVVALSDDDLARAVYYIANSEGGAASRKRDLIGTMIGADPVPDHDNVDMMESAEDDHTEATNSEA